MKSISFVSFKGGAGRSVLLANTAFQLAAESQLVVGCLDADLEAGGLHTIFRMRAPYDQFEPSEDQLRDTFPAQLYLMSEQGRVEEVSKQIGDELKFDIDSPEFVRTYMSLDVAERTRSQVLKDRFEGSNGELYLVPASPNALFTGQLDARGGNLFGNFSTLLANFSDGNSLDVLCVDCRAGISNLSFPALAYVDAVVVCMRWGRQHREGTRRFIRWYSEWLMKYRKDTKIFLVVSLINHSETEIRPELESFIAENEFDDIVQAVFFVPFVEKLTRGDSVLTAKEDEDFARNYFEIASSIVNQI